jgi:hypothetical protein
MKSTDRKLPMGVYPSPSSGGKRFIAAVRHDGTRHYLGSFGSVEDAAERVYLFRKEHPKNVVRELWQPGDKI